MALDLLFLVKFYLFIYWVNIFEIFYIYVCNEIEREDKEVEGLGFDVREVVLRLGG